MRVEDSYFLVSKLATKLVIKTVCYWHEERRRSMEEKSESRNKLTSMVSWFPTRMPRQFHGGENSLFNTWRWNMTVTCERRKVDPYLTPHAEVNSKWSKDVSVRTNTIKPSGNKTMGISLGDLELSNAFLGMTPKPHATKEKRKWAELHQNKKLAYFEGHQMKRKPTERKKILQTI